MMRVKHSYILLAIVALGGCDAAGDVAGRALGEQVRVTFIERCEQIAADSGIQSGNLTSACSCAADEFAAQVEGGELEINRDVIARTALECVDGTEPETPSTEQANG